MSDSDVCSGASKEPGKRAWDERLGQGSFSELCDLSQGRREVRELARWLSGGRVYPAEGTAKAKALRWECA